VLRAASAAALLWACVASGCSRPPLPHAIILITLDTTRADHLSSYGYERPTTPALDRLAATGVRFARAVSPMPATDPAHATLLTGLSPRTHGIRRNGERMARPGTETLATWARDAGYQTAAFTSRRHLRPSELWLGGFNDETGPEELTRSGVETFADARLWLRLHAQQPFFVWIHLFEPHWPYEPPAAYGARFLAPGATAVPLARERPSARPLPPELTATLVGLYDGEIAYMDALIGDFLRWIADLLPADDSPLIVVAGDHGEALGELEERLGLAFDHGLSLYQGLLQVPLVVHWQGRLPAGRVVERPVGLVDLAPTLFELLGVDGFATQGRSLAAAMLGREAERGSDPDGDEDPDRGRRYVYSERLQQRVGATAQYAVQDARHKLILSVPGRQSELYDLVADPGEVRNLADDSPDDRDRLLAALDAWLAATPAAGPGEGVASEKAEALRALGDVE
jgi:arylsulfatase A-like enzyme